MPGSSRSTRERRRRSSCSGPGASRRTSGVRADWMCRRSTPVRHAARVKLVLFAERDVRAPDPGWWPAGPRARHPAVRARRSNAARPCARWSRPTRACPTLPSAARGYCPRSRKRCSSMAEYGPVTCAGCGLLCDDVTVSVADDEVGLEPGCPAGRRLVLERMATVADGPAATIDGAPADLDAAVAQAAELLRGARRPLVHGFDGATVEDARAAVALADRLGALVSTGGVAGAWPGAPAVAAARRLDGHPGRDPRPFTGGGDLARGPRDHASAAAGSSRLRDRRGLSIA